MTPGVSENAIGCPVQRVEDRRFLTGHGNFVDDLKLPALTYACVLRSPHAHARIRRIDKSAAEAAPGVLLVLTGEDVVREGLGGLQCRMFSFGYKVVGPQHRPTHPILAAGKVRHVGDRVALVVAQTKAQAKDAAELIEVDYEPLSANAAMQTALARAAAPVWDDNESNVAFQLEHGERAAVERAFAGAAHVTKLAIHYPRAVANAIEPRTSIGCYDPFERRYTLYSGVQAPFRQRKEIAGTVLHFPETDLRVVAPDVGGAFGGKGAVYPEEALVVWAAGKLRRPVKWNGERSECLMSDMHGRDMLMQGELALAADGRMLALRVEIATNLGAYLTYAAGAPANIVGANLTSTYDLPQVHSVVRAVFTNTVPLGPYRGSGRPEAIHLLERLIERAAREMKIDSIALRRRNLVAPDAMPYRTASGQVMDCGDFARMLERNLEIAGGEDFPKRRAESERRGMRRV